MFEPLRLLVKTPSETILEVSGVHWVHVRLADGGGIGIWPGHAPLVAETVAGLLKYADESGEHSLRLKAGLLHITPGRVVIYTTGLVDSGAVDEQVGAGRDENRSRRLAAAILSSLSASASSAVSPTHDQEG